MGSSGSFLKYWLLLFTGIIIFFLLDLSLGSVSIPLSETINILLGRGSANESWEQIILLLRLPRVITAIGVGAGLAVSGLLMQTLFRNPLAGPFVLGISSGASLGVAFLVLGSGLFGGYTTTLFTGPWALVIASASGSFL